MTKYIFNQTLENFFLFFFIFAKAYLELIADWSMVKIPDL